MNEGAGALELFTAKEHKTKNLVKGFKSQKESFNAFSMCLENQRHGLDWGFLKKPAKISMKTEVAEVR